MILVVYEFAELADPVTETDLTVASVLPVSSAIRAKVRSRRFSGGSLRPVLPGGLRAARRFVRILRGVPDRRSRPQVRRPFGRQRRIAPVAVVVAAAVGDRPPEVALHVVDAVEVAIRVEEPQQDVLHDVFRIGLRSRAEIGEAVRESCRRSTIRSRSFSFVSCIFCLF